MAEGTDDFLEHFGVKGMKWGIRKKEETSERDKAMIDAYKAVPRDPISKSDSYKTLAANEKKFLAKAELDDSKDEPRKIGWRPTKQQVAVAAVGSLVVAAMVYGAVKDKKTASALAAVIPGAEIKPNLFNQLVGESKAVSWNGKTGFIQPSSWDQKEFTLPAGHVFNRISRVAETDYRLGTYATHSTDDFNRYVSAFRSEVGSGPNLKHVTMTATAPIRVPSLLGRLEAMRAVLTNDLGYDKSLGYEASPSDAKKAYEGLSGGPWASAQAKKLFDELKSKGFGAIIDDMDAGVIGESPLVLFDESKLGKKVTSDLDAAKIQAAEMALRELANRKR